MWEKAEIDDAAFQSQSRVMFKNRGNLYNGWSFQLVYPIIYFVWKEKWFELRICTESQTVLNALIS